MFTSPTLILGSEKQSDFLQTLRENAMATHVSKLAEAREVLTAENNALIVKEDGRLASEVTRLSHAHAKRVGALKAEQAVQFAEIKTGITERVASLVRQENKARELISGQDELIAIMEKAAINDTRMVELRNQNRSRNLVMFSSFGKKLIGSLQCRLVEDNNFGLSGPLVIDIIDVNSTGMTGVSGKNGDLKSVFTLASEPGILPKIINFSINYEKILGNYDLVLNENGTMTGISVGEMIFPDWTTFQKHPGECKVLLGTGSVDSKHTPK